jgi:phosphoglycolate phosphatase-like HAD superfamily hydrolase
MDKYHFNKEESVFIGDSLEDYRAAKDNDISFVLRHRGDNLSLFDKYDGPIFQSLN